MTSGMKVEAHRLKILFGLSGLKAAELHGNLTQAMRLDVRRVLDVLLFLLWVMYVEATCHSIIKGAFFSYKTAGLCFSIM